MKKIILLSLIISQALHSNAQISVCDSVSYSIGGSQPFTLTLNTPGLTNMIDSMEVEFSACNSIACWYLTGTTVSFQNIFQSDTVKACYEAYIYIDTMEYFCDICDSLVFDQNTSSWVLLISGCMDTTACNYNPLANTPILCLTDYGCTDPVATNYDPSATCDDGTCQYPTAIAELSPAFISDFYPNPAREIVYFDYYLNKSEKLIIMNILGNEVKTIKLSAKGRQKVNISDLSKGIYFGNIINNEVVIVKKLIVK